MKKTALLLALASAPILANAAYKCVDEKGITHIGDTPPAACATVMMYEVKPSGQVIRKIDPTPTPEQLKQRQEEAERRKEADKAAYDQKRKDQALLATYTSEKEFDVARDRNVAPLRSRITNIQDRIKAIEEREKKIAEEMEFYKAGKSKNAKTQSDAPPPLLVAERERLAQEKKSLGDNIANQEADIVQINARFEADKKRWVELRHPAQPSQAKADAPAAAAAPAPKK